MGTFIFNKDTYQPDCGWSTSGIVLNFLALEDSNEKRNNNMDNFGFSAYW